MIKRFFIIAFVCLFCLSCDYQPVYDQYQEIENTIWQKDKEYYFTFDIEDNSVPYNLTLEIRNNNMYPFQNLWLFLQEETPIGPLVRDTVECMLADDYGKWYGKGISLFQLSYPLKTAYYFPHSGQYTYSFRQGMRQDELPGIQEIGFRVELAD